MPLRRCQRCNQLQSILCRFAALQQIIKTLITLYDLFMRFSRPDGRKQILTNIDTIQLKKNTTSATTTTTKGGGGLPSTAARHFVANNLWIARCVVVVFLFFFFLRSATPFSHHCAAVLHSQCLWCVPSTLQYFASLLFLHIHT